MSNKFSYDELAPFLHKWANYYANEKYDKWDLIMIVWLKGNLQKLDTIKKASLRVRYDILDFLRSEEGANRKVKCRFVSLGDFIGFEKPANYDELERIETRDYVWNLLRKAQLTFCEQEVLFMYYWKNMHLTQIATIVGHSHEWCRKHIISAIHKLREVCNVPA